MKFSEAFRKIDTETKNLKEFLSSGVIVKAYAAPLPILNQHEKRSPDAGGYIPEAHLLGKAGIDTAILNLTSYYAAPGTNTFHVRLCPGLIQVKQSAMLEAEKLITLINSYKKQFSLAINEIKDKRLKHEEIHSIFPMLMTKQVSREINFIPAQSSLTSIGFSLAGKVDQTKLSYEEAVELCTDLDSSTRLSNYKGCELRIRKQKTKRFYANCRVQSEGQKTSTPIQLQGGIPIIAANKSDEPVKVNHFKSGSRNMAKRSARAEYTLICPTHHIYAMMPK